MFFQLPPMVLKQPAMIGKQPAMILKLPPVVGKCCMHGLKLRIYYLANGLTDHSP